MTIPSINFKPEQYTQLLDAKITAVSALLKPFTPSTAEVFASPKEHFRMRAEFRIWHTKNNAKNDTSNKTNIEANSRCDYVMFEPQAPRTPITITDFPIAYSAIALLMTPLIDQINDNILLSKKLFQIEFLASTTNNIVVTLIYHRQLDEVWNEAAKNIEKTFNIAVIGRARKQKVVLSNDFVIEKLDINKKQYTYEQKENSFTQPNATINQQMIQWCCDYLSRQENNKNSDLLEMYCGNGNFTIPLAQYFRRVIATEIAKSSIASAKRNCEFNQTNNIEFVRLSGEETSSALRKERAFRRLKHIDIDELQFSTVLVDPPRAGLDEKTLDFVSGFKRIIYISCNPETLAENMVTLQKTHQIKAFALFDQFPYTDHCECGLVLEQL